MIDTPYINDGADASLRKTVSLLNKIEAKTGSTTITGPVTVSNEVEVTNSTGNPIPVSGTVALDSNSLAALENISVTFPATQNVNVTNAGLSVSVSNLPATQPISGSISVSNLPATQPVSLATAPTTPVTGTFWQATQPVSLASAPVTPVTDNGGSLTVDGTVTVNDMTSGNAKTKIVDSVGADVSYITAGTAGTPSASVLSVQGISGGTSLPISGTVTANTGLTQPLTDAQLRNTAVPVSLATAPTTPVTGTFWQATQPISGTVTANTGLTPLTDTQLRAVAVPVSLATAPTTPVTGTFWQTTQPVSLATAPTTPVTGTFFQATQPVSLATAPTTPVTGTFWQATQPISGTVTANTGLTQPLTDTQLRASSVPISNTSTTGATPTTFTSTTYATISASNASRKGLTIFSEGAGLLYVTLGTSTTTASSYTARLSAGDYYEAPFGYTGLVGGLFGSAGTARVTEVI